MKGYVGQILFVDLTCRTVRSEPVTEELARNYLGATGFNTKLAYELIPPGADPLGPENVLIVGAGPFAGTLLPGACRTELTARSPNGGFFGITNSGVFGPAMKRAGADNLVLLGRAEAPVYLLLHDGEVAILPADDLWGRDVFETTETLWQRHPRSDVLAIGPAGENLIRYASVLGNREAAFGRTGMGAVMGSKRVKAIVALPGGDIQVAQPARFVGLCRKVFRALDQHPHVQDWREWGTLIQYVLAPGAGERYKALGFDIDKWSQTYRRSKFRSVTCPQCPVGCKMSAEVQEGPRRGLRLVASCSSNLLAVYGIWIGMSEDDFGDSVYLYELSNRLGLDSIEFLHMVEFLHRLKEERLITDEDIGFRFRRGDPEAMAALLESIARRRGLGSHLADGVRAAAEAIGRGAQRFAFTLKGETLPQNLYGYNLPSHPKYPGDRFRWDTTSVGVLVNPSGHISNRYSSITQIPGRKAEALRRYGRRCGMTQEEVEEAIWGDDRFDVALLTLYTELYHIIGHSFSLCQRPYFHRIYDIDLLRDLFSAATGLDLSVAELRRAAERIITLQRLFNLRNGLTWRDDLYPQGWMQDEKAEAEALAHIQRYYQIHGWTPEGVPTEETLARLGITEAV